MKDRYTVRMLQSSAPGLDINGVCRQVRDSLERGIIPVIEIDSSDHEAELGDALPTVIHRSDEAS